MKRFAVFTITLLTVWLVLPPVGTAQARIAPQEAASHVGELAVVCGAVASTHYAASSRGHPTFLNLDRAYPNQVFTVVIWGGARAAFPTPPESAYRGKRICVTGTISTYRGTPQIVVSSPSALTAKD